MTSRHLDPVINTKLLFVFYKLRGADVPLVDARTTVQTPQRYFIPPFSFTQCYCILNLVSFGMSFSFHSVLVSS